MNEPYPVDGQTEHLGHTTAVKRDRLARHPHRHCAFLINFRATCLGLEVRMFNEGSPERSFHNNLSPQEAETVCRELANCLDSLENF